MWHFKDSIKALLGKPLCNSAHTQKELAGEVQLAKWFDYTEQDIKKTSALLCNRPQEVKRILWLVCNFSHPFGGVFTILRIANKLEADGIENIIAIYDNDKFDIDGNFNNIKQYFHHLKASNFVAISSNFEALGSFDIAIATFWSSAYLLLKLENAKRKVYLIQDYEPDFYPASTTSALVQNTYAFPFDRLYNTKGLADYVQEHHPIDKIKTFAFTPAVDNRYFSTLKNIGSPIKVLVYARPDAPRNAYGLAMAFCDALLQKYGTGVEISCAGSSAKLNVASVKNVGIVPYKNLPKFYSEFHVSICFMMSKHPSYPPFELMASGSAIIANENEVNTWFYKDGENCVLSKPAVAQLLGAFERVISPELFTHVTSTAQELLMQNTWDKQLAKIKTFLCINDNT